MSLAYHGYDVLSRAIRWRVSVSVATKQQYTDNRRWIEGAEEHRLVVGSQARILYSDQFGRIAIALAFNKAVREGRLKVGT